MRIFGLFIIAYLSSASACAKEDTLPQRAPLAESAALGHREVVARGAPLIDVRTPQEFAGGHLEGAINIPVDQVGSRLGEIDGLVAGKDKTVVVYCRSGNRSGAAARTLRAAGYEVIDFGPMSAW